MKGFDTVDIPETIKIVPAYTVKRYPIESSLLILCILLLAGVGVWGRFSPLPARDWNTANLTEIKVADPNNFSFAVFGDNRNSSTVFENLLKLIDHDPDIAFAISLGDMVQDGEKERYLYFFNQVKRYLGLPLLTALGNHEIRGKGRQLYREIFGRFYYSFRIGGNYFIVLDDANGKGLTPKEKQWLEDELGKSQDCHIRIAFMHFPLYDPSGEGDHHSLPEKSAEDLAGVFLKHRISHIFASHIHGYFEGQWKGIPYTITGGAGAELERDDSGHYLFHFLKVHIRNGGVDVEVKHVPSPNYEWMGRSIYALWLYIHTFLRIHWIETALFLVAGGLVIVTCLSELRGIKR